MPQVPPHLNHALAVSGVVSSHIYSQYFTIPQSNFPITLRQSPSPASLLQSISVYTFCWLTYTTDPLVVNNAVCHVKKQALNELNSMLFHQVISFTSTQ